MDHNLIIFNQESIFVDKRRKNIKSIAVSETIASFLNDTKLNKLEETNSDSSEASTCAKDTHATKLDADNYLSSYLPSNEDFAEFYKLLKNNYFFDVGFCVFFDPEKHPRINYYPFYPLMKWQRTKKM